VDDFETALGEELLDITVRTSPLPLVDPSTLRLHRHPIPIPGVSSPDCLTANATTPSDPPPSLMNSRPGHRESGLPPWLRAMPERAWPPGWRPVVTRHEIHGGDARLPGNNWSFQPLRRPVVGPFPPVGGKPG
jgi:hypothetical protein